MRIKFLASATAALHLTSLYPTDSLRITGTSQILAEEIHVSGSKKSPGGCFRARYWQLLDHASSRGFSVPRYMTKVTYLRESVIFRIVGVPRQS